MTILPKKNTESDLNLLNSEDFGIKNPLNAGWLNLGKQCLLSPKNWLTWIPVFDHHQIKIGKRILDKIMTFLFVNYQFPVFLVDFCWLRWLSSSVHHQEEKQNKRLHLTACCQHELEKSNVNAWAKKKYINRCAARWGLDVS